VVQRAGRRRRRHLAEARLHIYTMTGLDHRDHPTKTTPPAKDQRILPHSLKINSGTRRVWERGSLSALAGLDAKGVHGSAICKTGLAKLRNSLRNSIVGGLACETRQNAPLVEPCLMVARRGRAAFRGTIQEAGAPTLPQHEVPLSHLSHIHTHLAHQSDVKIIRVGVPPSGQRAGLLLLHCVRINANPGVPHF
jgi:hypothetical protein